MRAMTVGTSPDCDITIEDATQTLGSTHAKIFNKHGCTWFQDLGTSEHGTCLILGHAKGGRDEYCLCTGDEFRIGQDNGISVKVLEIHREVKTEFYRKKKIFDRAHSKMSNFDFAEQKVVESKSTVASGAGNGKKGDKVPLWSWLTYKKLCRRVKTCQRALVRHWRY